MIIIARTFEWDMGHRVPNHESLCKNPHGHRYVMHVYVTGGINETSDDPGEGMVVDFGKLKSLINTRIVDRLDHSFMYDEHDTIMAPFAQLHNDLRMNPVPFVPTAEKIVEHLASEIPELLNKCMPGLVLVRIELFETPKSKAVWSRDA